MYIIFWGINKTLHHTRTPLVKAADNFMFSSNTRPNTCNVKKKDCQMRNLDYRQFFVVSQTFFMDVMAEFSNQTKIVFI